MRGGWVERGTVTIRLGRAHFAFFRGYLDGLDLDALAARYLTFYLPSPNADAQPDLRLAKAALKWIREQLLSLARRSLTPTEVRLLAVAPEALAVRSQRSAPSLEAFRDEHDADRIYGEAELISLYEQIHGDKAATASRRAVRNQRMRQRQQQVLTALEAGTARHPQPSDRIDGWLDPVLARRLGVVGIDELADLVALIDRHGYHWYRKVPRIGIKAALHIGQWLQADVFRNTPELQPSGQHYHPPRSLPPASPGARRTAMVPLELFRMPKAAVDKAEGDGSPDACALIGEVAAIELWLSEKQTNSHTWRAYRKEAERLLLWSVLERGRSLGSMTVADCIAYRDFLRLIGTGTVSQWEAYFHLPQENWIGTTGAGRNSRFWRPFQGQLSGSSQRQALSILSNLFRWLYNNNYILSNPMQEIGAYALAQNGPPLARLLSATEWQLVRTYLAAQSASLANARLRCLLALSAGTGLRIAQLATLRREQLQRSAGVADTGDDWQLFLPGSPGFARPVALSSAAMTEVRAYVVARGFVDLERMPLDAPMIAALPSDPSPPRQDSALQAPEALLTVDRIHRIIKRLFEQVADGCAGSAPASAAQLRAASSDWLRRTPPDQFSLDPIVDKPGKSDHTG